MRTRKDPLKRLEVMHPFKTSIGLPLWEMIAEMLRRT